MGVRRTIGHIRAYIGNNHYTAAASTNLSNRARAAVYLTRLVIRILKQWARDKCLQQAAALTFNTALSLVPVTAIAFTILRSVGSLDAQSRLSEFIATRMFPGMEAVTQHIEEFSKNISVGALGGAGLFFTISTCYSLYSNVERIFNDIWRVGTRRSEVGMFLEFYAMVTLLPDLASESLKAAFVGFAKNLLLSSYTGVYGSLGLIPLMLLWIYASWTLVLLGAEIAFAVQNLRLLEAEDRRQSGAAPINGLLAAQLLAVVAGAHELSGKGVSKASLITEFGLAPDAVDRVVERRGGRGRGAGGRGGGGGGGPGRAAGGGSLD